MTERQIKKSYDEWNKQSSYDFETAQAMFSSGRYIYAIFFCHLAVEKLLKGIFLKESKKEPEKIHNLNYFIEKLDLKIDTEKRDFIDNLNDLSVPVRYPDELEKLLKDFDNKETAEILKKTGELLTWLRSMI
ncbi:MAG: HEPN domain-containing protein [Candidatus Aminicenantes bacterium]|nr:HEPN domain-containing protein [Candidatus Aminicenantes bacterium]